MGGGKAGSVTLANVPLLHLNLYPVMAYLGLNAIEDSGLYSWVSHIML